MKPLPLLFALVAIASPAMAATNVGQFTYHHRSAAADFLSTDDSVCPQGIETLVSLSGGFFDSRTTDGDVKGRKTTNLLTHGSVTISVFDYCRNVTVVFASGDAEDMDLEIDQNLGTARLRGSVPVLDYSIGAILQADVDITWDAIAPARNTSFNETFHEAGVTIATHSAGKLREATAYGSVRLLGRSDQDPAKNYTPRPASSADFGFCFIERDGSLERRITFDESASAARAGTESVTSARSTTWGRLKALYR